MTQAAIIGGGIAGLATGLCALGNNLPAKIFEKNPQLRCEDNLLWLAPNGLHLLDALGLLGAVRAHGVPQTMMHFSTSGLQPLLSLDGAKLERTNDYPILAIRRGTLYQLLLDRYLAAGGEIAYGHTLTGITPADGKLRLTFACRDDGVGQDGRINQDGQDKRDKHSGPTVPGDHSTTVTCDYAIGADGIGSTVRRLAFPASSVAYQGIRTYLGHSVTPLAARYVGQTIEAWGVGTRFVLTSLDGRTVYWSAIERPAVYEKNGAPIPRDIAERLRAAFTGYHPDIGAIIDSAVTSSVHRCNFGVVTGLPRYHNDHIVLIGDAAHGMPPNMGQGASLALEDAYALIMGLATGIATGPATGMADGRSPAQVFRAYDRARRPRAKQMIQIANGMNATFQPRTRLGSLARNYAAAAFPDGLSQRRMAHLYRVPFAVSRLSITPAASPPAPAPDAVATSASVQAHPSN